jgi:hypothetical protein
MRISDSVRVMIGYCIVTRDSETLLVDGSGTDGNTVFGYGGGTYRGVCKYDDFDQCKDYW